MTSRAALLTFRDSISWSPVRPEVDGEFKDVEPRAWVFRAVVNGMVVSTRVFQCVGGYRFLIEDEQRRSTMALAQSAVENYWLNQLGE